MIRAGRSFKVARDRPMRILLGNTGRGGEQCIFSAIVHAYRVAYPDAYICIAICPEFKQLWHGNDEINDIYYLEHHTKGQPHYMDPVGHWNSYAGSNTSNFDIVEYACEHGLEQQHADAPRPAVENIWGRLRHKPCTFDKLGRHTRFTPNQDEESRAQDIINACGPDLLLISHISNSAQPVQSFDGYAEIARVLSSRFKVACTGRLDKPGPGGPETDPYIPGTVDLRGISFLTLYALSRQLRFYLGPDTATSWLVSGMPGRMVVLRGDYYYSIANTGLVVNGFRRPDNTHEIEVVGKDPAIVAGECLRLFSA